MRVLVVVSVLAALLSTAHASDTDEINKLIATQAVTLSPAYTDDPTVIVTTSMINGPWLSSPSGLIDAIAPPSTSIGGDDVKNLSVAIARDGKSAWASFTTQVSVNDSPRPFRVSDVLAKTDKGWRIAATAWTEPVANDKANKDAKAGKRSLNVFDAPAGDASLAAAFNKLIKTDGVDATAAARKDVVAIGSGPGERTVGGALLARAWKASWLGHVTLDSLVAHTLPTGTTGWVAATVKLDKKGYKMPFLVFCVFDKTAGGDWTLVHIHFAV